MIKYNERGEVVAVNGIITGHNIGTPLQDAKPEKPEDNECYCEEKRTVTKASNIDLDAQPTPSGGGSSDIFKEIFDKTIIEVTSDAITVNDYAFQNCASLTKAIFPRANAIKQYAFDGCASLAEIDFKEVTSVGTCCFQNCVSLESVRLPKLTGKTMNLFNMSVGNGAGGVNNGTAVRLKVADLGFVTTVNNSTFRHCTSLTTVILRSTTVATLEHIGAFWYTPFYHLATGGTVYVPAALIESYKAASNWSALHTSASLNFAPIEGSEYE